MLISRTWLVAPISESSSLRALTAPGFKCHPLIHVPLVSLRWIGQHKYTPLASSVPWGFREDEARKSLPPIALRKLATWGWKILQRENYHPHFSHSHIEVSWDIWASSLCFLPWLPTYTWHPTKKTQDHRFHLRTLRQFWMIPSKADESLKCNK